MGKVITIMNMKGGVGKTTVAMHLAGMLARYMFGRPTRRKVLIIDYDPQFNLSQAFIPAKQYFKLESERKTTLAVLVDSDADLNPYQLQVTGNHVPPNVGDIATLLFHYKDLGRLDIIPSTLDLMYVALGQADTQFATMEERFQKFVSECKSLYDVVIIDCHPAGSIFTKTSLRNSDHVVIPVIPQRYAVRGIGLMLNFIEAKNVGSLGPMPHILFNATSRTGASSQEIEIRGHATFGKHCMKNSLKWYSAFSDPEAGVGFVWNSTKPYSNQAFHNLSAVAAEFIARTGV